MGQIEEISNNAESVEDRTSISALREWLVNRISDEEDVVVDELQEEKHAYFELRDDKDPDAPRGTEEYLRNCELSSEEKQGLCFLCQILCALRVSRFEMVQAWKRRKIHGLKGLGSYNFLLRHDSPRYILSS